MRLQALSHFVNSVRTASTIEEEKVFVATEQAQIHALIRKMETGFRRRFVAKLVFFDMCGQNPA